MKLLWLCLCLCMGLSALHAQQIRHNDPAYRNVSLGYSAISELLPEAYRYHAVNWLARMPIWARKRWQFYGEGQFVFARQDLLQTHDYEMGWNGGFMYTQPLGASSSLTAAIGSGPHWITLKSRLQARGYIFSDNIELGWHRDLGKTHATRLGILFRFRHISNAGLASPNGGVDNFFLQLGFSWL